MATPPKDGIGGLLPIQELTMDFKMGLDKEAEGYQAVIESEEFINLVDSEKEVILNEIKELEKLRSLLDSRISKF